MGILPSLHLTLERWKFNKEYGVWVSTLGRFKDINKFDIPYKIYEANGYVAIKTKYGNKPAHRLVMYTWSPIDDRESFTVDHKNHNKRDNRLINLEWVTAEENAMRADEDLIRRANAVTQVKKATTQSKQASATATAYISLEGRPHRFIKNIQKTNEIIEDFLATHKDGYCYDRVVSEDGSIQGTIVECVIKLLDPNADRGLPMGDIDFKKNCKGLYKAACGETKFCGRRWKLLNQEQN